MSVPLPEFLANFTLEDVLAKVKGVRERDLDKSGYKEKEYRQMLSRFTTYLKEMLLKIKLALAIPLLLKKSAQFQDDDEVRRDILRIKKLCSPLLRSTFKYEEFNMPTGKNWCHMIDCNLVEAAEIFYKNDKLRNMSLAEFLSPPAMVLFTKITDVEEYFPQMASKLPYFIDSPRILEDIFEIPKRVSGRMTRETEEVLKEKREQVKAEIIKKRKHIKKYENVRRLNKEFVELETPVAMHIAIRNMHLMQSKHESFEEILLEDRDLVESAYQSTLQMNIETDKILLQKRSKLLLQIEVWVKRYDEDVSAKMDELDQAKIRLNQQRVACNEFYREYDRMGKEYFDLLALLNEREMLAEAELEKKKALNQLMKLKKKGKNKPQKNAKYKPEVGDDKIQKKDKNQKKMKK